MLVIVQIVKVRPGFGYAWMMTALVLVVRMLVVVQMVKVHPCVGDTYVIGSIDGEGTLWRWRCRD